MILFPFNFLFLTNFLVVIGDRLLLFGILLCAFALAEAVFKDPDHHFERLSLQILKAEVHIVKKILAISLAIVWNFTLSRCESHVQLKGFSLKILQYLLEPLIHARELLVGKLSPRIQHF
jgi:hypothetical protein